MSDSTTGRTAEEIAESIIVSHTWVGPTGASGPLAKAIASALRAAEDRGWNEAVEKALTMKAMEVQHVCSSCSFDDDNEHYELIGAARAQRQARAALVSIQRPPRAEEGEKPVEEIVRRYDRLLTEHLRRFEAIEKRLDAIERRPKSHKEPQ